MEPLFGPPDQRSTFYDQGALYRIGGQMCMPLHTVGYVLRFRKDDRLCCLLYVGALGVCEGHVTSLDLG